MSKRVDRKTNVPKTRAISSWDGWMVFFSQLVIAFGFLLFGLVHFAFSSPPYAEIRSISREAPAETRAATWIRGPISWNHGTARIQDQNSGKVYQLSNSVGLKKLWDSGIRDVAVAGHVTGNGLLNVEEIDTTH